MLSRALLSIGGTVIIFPNMPSSLEQLDLLLLEIPKSRKIHSDGIHFQGFRYSNTNLAAYVGEYVLIRYNPNDMAEIRVFIEMNFFVQQYLLI